jgi:hypothetical protein
MDGTVLADGDKLRFIGLLSSYTLSEARMAHDAAQAARAAMAAAAAAGPDGPPPVWTYEALLRELADEQTYPRLHRLAWAHQVGDSPSGWDEQQEFLFGVNAILDAVQAMIDRNAAGGS